MLMRYEFAMLFALARHNYLGEGAIVDGGPLTGITSNALARGILANPNVKGRKRRIFAFDLFDHIPNQEVLNHVPNRNGSVLDTFLDVNRDYLDLISVMAGDLLSHTWNSGPIEILMIDLAKSWELNEFVLDQWFPLLRVGASLVQQDYCSWFTYWLPITMMALKDHFQFVDYAMGGSTIFRCTKPVPPGMGQTIRAMGFGQHERLLDEAIARAPEPLKPVLTCSKAAFFVSHQMQDRALALLPSVSLERMTEDWSIDFSGVAMGSRDAVRFLAELPGDQLARYGLFPA